MEVDHKEIQDRITKYTNTFATPEGEWVLLDFLKFLGYFEEIKNEEGRIKHNVGRHILLLASRGLMADKISRTKRQ